MSRIYCRLIALTIALALLSAAMFSRVSAGPKDVSKATPAEKKDPAAAQDQEPLISRMRVQDYPGGHYFYKATEATLAQMNELVPSLLVPMMASIGENHVSVSGPMTFVYHGVTQDPNKAFDLQIGFPVSEGTKEIGDYKVRELEPFHCATVIYSGPIATVGKAYEQVFGDLFAAGLTPTGETREMYLYWESQESMNNIELIMIGVSK